MWLNEKRLRRKGPSFRTHVRCDMCKAWIPRMNNYLCCPKCKGPLRYTTKAEAEKLRKAVVQAMRTGYSGMQPWTHRTRGYE